MGHEQAKRHPCLVISADMYHQGCAGLVAIIPITSSFRELYWHVPINPPEGGLSKLSYILCDQMRCVSLERFSSQCLGFVSDYTLSLVEERVRVLLGLVE
jgi:mRNA interferase MazF